MFIYKVRTDKDTNFTGAIAQNAGATANLVVPAGLSGMDGQVELILRGITVISKENLSWETQFFASDAYQNADLDLDGFIARWTFAASDAVQIGATGTYEYYIDGLEIPLWDNDRSGEIHLELVNRSAASKTAGAAGQLVVTLWIEVMQAGFGA